MGDPQSELGSLRLRLDQIDGRLLELLNARATLVEEAFALKRSQGQAFYDSRRVAEILERVRRLNRGPLEEREVETLFAAVLDYFGLEFRTGPILARCVTEPPTPLQGLDRPWLIADVPRGAGSRDRGLEMAELLGDLGIRLVRASASCWHAQAGFLRIGRDRAADLREHTPGGRGMALQPGRGLVLRRRRGQHGLGAWLRTACASALTAGCPRPILLVPVEPRVEVRRVLARTDFPLIVDVRGGRRKQEAGLAALADGADGILLGWDADSPEALRGAVVAAREASRLCRRQPGMG